MSTQVHFHVQKDDSELSFTQYCYDIIHKAYQKRRSVFIAVDNYTQMAEWDKRLWEDPTSFIPHDCSPTTLPCPVLLGLGSEHPDHSMEIVINLSMHPISKTSGLVIECILATPEAKNQGRIKFRHYQAQQAPIVTDFF